MATKNGTLETVAIEKVKPATDNIRGDLGELAELAASIKSVGVLEPLLVVASNRGYSVVAGNRRLAAAKKAGLKHVPVIVRDLDEKARTEVMLIENLQREDLPPMDEARGYRRLIDEHAYSQRQLAERIGRSQAHISKRLALLALPEPVQAQVDSGGIAVADALELTKLAGDPDRLDQAVKDGKRYGGIERSVEQQLAEKTRSAKLAEAIAQAEKDPAPYLPMRKGKYGSADLPAGAALLGGGYGKVDVKQSDHKKLPCHAVTVLDPHYGQAKIAYICTDPKSHGAKAEGVKGGKLSEAEKKARAEKREHAKAIREAERARAEFMTGLLRKQVAIPEALEQIVGAWLTLSGHSAHGKDGSIACELLGVDVVERKNTWGGAERDAHGPLAAFALKSKANIARVALALAFERAEAEIRTGAWSWHRDLAKAHMDYLKGRGYKVSPAEKAELAGKAPR